MARWSPLLAHRARETHKIVTEAGGARCMRAVGDKSGHLRKEESIAALRGDQIEHSGRSNPCSRYPLGFAVDLLAREVPRLRVMPQW